MVGSIFSDDFQTAIPSNDVMKQLLALSSMQEATDYTPIATGLKSIGKVFTDAEDAMLKDNTATARRAIQSINPQQMVKLLDKGIDPVQTLFNAGLTFNPDDAGLMSAYEKHREQSINDVTNQWVAKLDSIPHNEWVEFIQGKKPDLFEQHGMTPWTRLPLSLRQAVTSKLDNVKKSEFYKSLFNGGNLTDADVGYLEGIDATTLKALGENLAKFTQDRNAYLGRSSDAANGLIGNLDTKTQQFVNDGVKTFIKNFMTNYAGVYGSSFNLDKLTDENYDTLTEGIDPTIKDFVISQVKRLHAAGALRPMFDTHVATDYSEANYGQKLLYDKDFANAEGRVDDPLTFLENHPFMTWYKGLPTTEAGRVPILKSVTDNYGAAMYQDTLNNNPEYVKHILQDKDAIRTLAQKEKTDLELIDQYGVDKDDATFAKLSTQAYYANLRKLASDSRERQKVENEYNTYILSRQLIEEAPKGWLRDTAAVLETQEPLEVTDRYKKLPNAKLQIITEAVADSRLSKIYPTQETDRKLFAQYLCENIILPDEDVNFTMDTITPEDLRSILKKNKEAYDNNAVLDFLKKLFKYNQAATARKGYQRDQTGQNIIDRAPRTPDQLKQENTNK